MNNRYDDFIQRIKESVSNLALPNLGFAKAMLQHRLNEQDSLKAALQRDFETSLSQAQTFAIQLMLRHHATLWQFDANRNFKDTIKALANQHNPKATATNTTQGEE